MSKKLKYKGDAFEAIHGSAAGMLRAGTIDKATMRGFDESCLIVPPAIEPVGEANTVSQPVSTR